MHRNAKSMFLPQSCAIVPPVRRLARPRRNATNCNSPQSDVTQIDVLDPQKSFGGFVRHTPCTLEIQKFVHNSAQACLRRAAWARRVGMQQIAAPRNPENSENRPQKCTIRPAGKFRRFGPSPNSVVAYQPSAPTWLRSDYFPPPPRRFNLTPTRGPIRIRQPSKKTIPLCCLSSHLST
jgi:hypothetical protein